ncbi:MAG: MBL fold metallo-hydrolase [Syntrophobacteraceae bacterium]|jgi:glyoxylase-like metal-dependent hydrolase (beta-lactamase superfamily II)
MNSGFRLGDFELTWLSGGKFELDGGAMFGVVPKVLWQKKYPVDSENYIPLAASPILLKTAGSLVLIESGLGNKLTDKQKNIFRLREEWSVPQDLTRLGIDRQEINFVVLTHYDFDHAGGVVMQDETGKLELTFPKAKHVLQKREWDDVMHPNVRSINTYWPLNYELLKGSKNLELVDGEVEIVPGVSVVRTGGHNGGHQILKMESRSLKALHLGDLLPTHAHANPLWIMAYDNYPMDSIAGKESWIKAGVNENAWFTFYHDATLLACKFDEQGRVIDRWGAA